MCLPDLENLIFSIPIFSPNFSPISLPFLKEQHPILPTLGAFHVVLGSFVSDENQPIAIPNFAKKAPQRAVTYTYTMSMRDPPPPRVF